MKTVIVVEYGSIYSDRPWEIIGIFENETLADQAIDKYLKESPGSSRFDCHKSIHKFNKIDENAYYIN